MRRIALLATVFAISWCFGACADDLESPMLPAVAALDSLRVEAFGSPQDQIEPVTASLWVDVDGGSGRNTISWLSGESEIGGGTVAEASGLMAGNHRFVVSVTDDSMHVTMTDSVTIRVLPALPPEIETFTFTTNLWVGPSRDHDSGTFSTAANEGRYYTQMQFRMDVQNADRSNVIVGVHYADDSWAFLSIPDVLPERPAVFWADCGELRWEPTVDVHLWFEEDGYAGKCDGTDRLLAVTGTREVPASKASGIIATRLVSSRWLLESLGL